MERPQIDLESLPSMEEEEPQIDLERLPSMEEEPQIDLERLPPMEDEEEPQKDLELLHSLAVEAIEQQQESEPVLCVTNYQQLYFSDLDDEMNDEKIVPSPVVKTGTKRGCRKGKAPAAEEKNEGGSGGKVWSERLRPRKTPDSKQKTVKCGSASKAASPKKGVSLKLSLTQKEITDDFLKMTGKKPSQKPNNKRTKVEKLLIPGLQLGTTLVDVSEDTYEPKPE